MSNPQPLPAAARYPHGLHSRFYRLQGGYMRHDEPGDDDVFEATFRALERLLSGVERKPEIAVAQVLGIGQARAINVGDYSRLDQYHPHSCHPQGLVVFFAREEANHRPKPYARLISWLGHERSQHRNVYGEQPVNVSLGAAGESLAQIADQSPRYSIGQDQSPDNSPLLLVIDPSDDSDIAVDDFNVGAAAKRIRDHQRFTQRSGLVVGHQSLRNSHSSAARFKRSDSPRLPLTPASGALSISDQPNKERGHAKYDRICICAYDHLIERRRQDQKIFAEQQPQPETLTDTAPCESAAVEISHPFPSHSNTTPIAFRRQG
jgi:hypothetical protein